MKTRKSTELGAALVRKGFRARQGDHTFYILYVSGRKTSIRTKIGHGSKEYGAGLLGQISKDLHLGRRDFDQLVECPISHHDYVRLLVEQGKLASDVLAGQLGLGRGIERSDEQGEH